MPPTALMAEARLEARLEAVLPWPQLAVAVQEAPLLVMVAVAVPAS